MSQKYDKQSQSNSALHHPALFQRRSDISDGCSLLYRHERIKWEIIGRTHDGQVYKSRQDTDNHKRDYGSAVRMLTPSERQFLRNALICCEHAFKEFLNRSHNLEVYSIPYSVCGMNF